MLRGLRSSSPHLPATCSTLLSASSYESVPSPTCGDRADCADHSLLTCSAECAMMHAWLLEPIGAHGHATSQTLPQSHE
eukprot:1945062-Pleurochrysis_carterae.AAC.2